MIDEVCEFAERFFKLHKPAKNADGSHSTAASHIEQLNRSRVKRGKKPLAVSGEPAAGTEPEGDFPPADTGHLWNVYLDLRGAVGGGFGPGPIPHAEIEAYSRLYGISFMPVEVDLLRAVDRIFLKVMADGGPRGTDASA